MGRSYLTGNILLLCEYIIVFYSSFNNFNITVVEQLTKTKTPWFAWSWTLF